jgi:hypothetical protein
VTHAGAAGSQETFVLEAGDHVGQLGVIVGVEHGGIKGLETGRRDDGADLDLVDLFGICEVDGISGAVFFTGPTFAFLDEDTVLRIESVFQGNGLAIRDIGGLAFAQSAIEFVGDFFGAFFRAHATCDTLIDIDIARVFLDGYGKITSFACNLLYLTEGEEFDVQVPTALYQFR